jgi:CHASE2 domain-containing sensor protein
MSNDSRLGAGCGILALPLLLVLGMALIVVVWIWTGPIIAFVVFAVVVSLATKVAADLRRRSRT